MSELSVGGVEPLNLLCPLDTPVSWWETCGHGRSLDGTLETLWDE